MGAVLNAEQRRHLDGAVQRARTAAEQASADALRALGVADPSRPAYLNDDDNSLRLALREKARQLGDDTARSGANLTNLMREVAYEQWHRLLFARFLEVNGLLRHPEYRDTSLALDDCADLADDLGEPDGWSVAARFASEILPGVFRLDDPAVPVRFAIEHRLELEKILLSLPSEVFETEDALGWVYQFWQTAEKKRVNESGVKIGGADLSPVTQLFTENYMVRFLLENSLGAWWAARHPDSSLVDGWEYLRRLDDGTPAAGTFDEWPATAAEVTVMDPCCGSGHFLIAMFGMLWRMRAEEERLSPAEAQDAVLRDNLHGLELDPRCTQIATFNVALEAWKQGGFRDLPAPQVACSGVPVRAPRSEWEALAGDDELRKVMTRLHASFQHADTLGSLIDPRPVDSNGAFFGRDLSIGVSANRVRNTLGLALGHEPENETVLGHAAADVLHAADLLARTYTLVATNPPFLSSRRTSPALQEHMELHFGQGANDLATSMIMRMRQMVGTDGSMAVVSPHTWLYLKTLNPMREWAWSSLDLRLLGWLGPGAFSSIGGEIVNVVLGVFSAGKLHHYEAVDVSRAGGTSAKADGLRDGPLVRLHAERGRSGAVSIPLVPATQGTPLGDLGKSFTGLQTGDDARFRLRFWELDQITDGWRTEVASDFENGSFGGRYSIVRWEGDSFFRTRESAHLHAVSAEGEASVVIRLMGSLPVTLYDGGIWHQNCARFVPRRSGDLPAVWAFMSSQEFEPAVREVDHSIKVTPASIAKVRIDLDRWRKVAQEEADLPEPHSDDPRQWLFNGGVPSSDLPLQVAVARLLGFCWPDQKPDELDPFADKDGIAALPSLPGEPDLATRLRELLTTAYGSEWSSTLERTLVTDAGGKNGRLEDWLRDSFFAQHVKVFDNRPFLWHIWDGRKDGFSAIVNYHRLDHRTLEKLTFTSLGAWIERQRHETAAGRAGADARHAAAETLQEKLKFILEGTPPHDVFVRWKELHQQPIGWNPDLDDGVRLNIRPFVTAGVLRSRVNVHWKKDRGTNSDGSERHNDLHPTLEERRAARRLVGGTS